MCLVWGPTGLGWVQPSFLGWVEPSCVWIEGWSHSSLLFGTRNWMGWNGCHCKHCVLLLDVGPSCQPTFHLLSPLFQQSTTAQQSTGAAHPHAATQLAQRRPASRRRQLARARALPLWPQPPRARARPPWPPPSRPRGHLPWPLLAQARARPPWLPPPRAPPWPRRCSVVARGRRAGGGPPVPLLAQIRRSATAGDQGRPGMGATLLAAPGHCPPHGFLLLSPSLFVPPPAPPFSPMPAATLLPVGLHQPLPLPMRGSPWPEQPHAVPEAEARAPRASSSSRAGNGGRRRACGLDASARFGRMHPTRI